MSAIPTVTLKHKVYGIMKVNAHDYAANIGGWVNRGWKLVNEHNPGTIEVNSDSKGEDAKQGFGAAMDAMLEKAPDASGGNAAGAKPKTFGRK